MSFCRSVLFFRLLFFVFIPPLAPALAQTPPALSALPSGQTLCLVHGQPWLGWTPTVITGPATEFWAVGLPPGLTQNRQTGLISGVPQLVGSFSVQLGATNSFGGSYPVVLPVTIYPSGGAPPVPQSLESMDISGKRAVVASGLDLSSRVIAPNLPAGLAVSSREAALLGTPTQIGHHILDLTVTNVYGQKKFFSKQVISVLPQPWTEQTVTTDSFISLSAVAHSGTLYVVAGTNGTFFTSPDLVTWTPTPSGVSSPLQALIYADGRFVATSQSGNILTSNSGQTWTVVTPVPNASLRSIAFGNGLYVIVGDSNTVLTSADGSSWTARLPATTSFRYNAVSFGEGLFVACGDGGRIVTSADGVTWTLQTTNTSANLTSIAYQNGRFVAMGGQTSILSDNGIHWTPASRPPVTSLSFLSAGQGLFLVTEDRVLWTSEDGNNWQPQAYAMGGRAGGLSSQNLFILLAGGKLRHTSVGRWVPVSNTLPDVRIKLGSPISAQISASNSPTSFTAVDLPPGTALNPSTGVISGIPTEAGVYQIRYFATNSAGPGLLHTWRVEVVTDATSAPKAFAESGVGIPTRIVVGDTLNYSVSFSDMDFDSTIETLSLPPGLTATRESPSKMSISGACTAPGIFSIHFRATNAAGTTDAEYPVIAWSNGWELRSDIRLVSIEFGNGVFVGRNSNGETVSSSDGLTWTNVGQQGVLVRFVGDRFIQPGTAGTLKTSLNGITWTPAATGTTNALYAVSGGGGRYVVAGQAGEILWSSDAIHWHRVTAGVSVEWRFLEYFAGRFWLAAPTGQLFSSVDGIQWTPVIDSPDAGTVIQSLAAIGDRLILRRGGASTGPWQTTDGISWSQATMTIEPSEIPNSTLSGRLIASGGKVYNLQTSGKIHVQEPGESTWKEYDAPRSGIMDDIAVGNGISIVVTSLTRGYYRQGSLWPPLLLGTLTTTVKGRETATYQLRASNAPTRFHAFGLPEGFTFNEFTGVLEGSFAEHTERQLYSVWVAAENDAGISQPRSLTLEVLPASGTTPSINSSASFAATVGQVAYYKIEIGNSDRSSNVHVDNLPLWLTYNVLSGWVSGTPPAPGTYEFRIRAINAYGETVQPVVVSVRDQPWTQRESLQSVGRRWVHFANGVFVAASTTFEFSTDGVTWTSALFSNPGSAPGAVPLRFSAPAYGNGRWLAIADNGSIAVAESPSSWNLLPGASLPGCLSLAFGDGLFVAVCSDGIFTSPDGTVWTSRYSNPSPRRVWSVAYSNGIFVAVGTNETILRSEDGLVWTLQPRPQTLSDASVVSVLDGEFVVFFSGWLLRSNNGLDWTKQTFSTSYSIHSAASGGGRYVALMASKIPLTSFDLVTWQEQPGPLPSESLANVVYGNGRFVAAGSGIWSAEAAVPRLSPPGNLEARVGQPFRFMPDSGNSATTYQISGLPPGLSFDSVTGALAGQPLYSGDYTLAVTAFNSSGASEPIFVKLRILDETGPLPELASDPVFIVRNAGAPLSYQILARHLTQHSEIFVSNLPEGLLYDPNTRTIRGVATTPGTSTAMIRITNAYGSASFPLTIRAGESSWTTDKPLGEVSSLHAVAVGNGKTIVINSVGSIFVSSTRGQWVEAATKSNGVYIMAFGNGVFVAAGNNGRILTSTDGLVWTPRASGVTQNLTSVSFANNTFLVTGNGGTFLTSQDGITWNRHNVGTTLGLRDATYSNGLYIVVGNSGIIRTSPNLVTWTNRGVGSGTNLVAIASGGGQILAVGTFGVICQSTDGVAWTRQSHPWISEGDFEDLGFENSRFVLLTEDRILYSTNGTEWIAAREELDDRFASMHCVGDGVLVGTDRGFLLETPDLRSPFLLRLANLRGYVGMSFSHPIIASNFPTSYEVEGLPAELLFDPLSGIITGTPAFPGRHVLTIRASNPHGTDLFSLTMDIDSPPLPLRNLPALSVMSGQWLSVEVVDRADGSLFSAENLVEGLSIDSLTGRISGYPSRVGSFFTRIRAAHPNGTRVAGVSIVVRHPAPVVISQPESVIAPEGEDVFLSANIAGGGNLSYRWRKNGQAVADTSTTLGSTTSVLQLRDLSLSDTGHYDLEVTNESGTTLTAPARVETLQTFEGWARRRGLPPAQSGPLDSPEPSGVPNLVAFAFGIPPTLGGTDHLPVPDVATDRLVYRFKTLENMTGVSIVPEISTDLRAWNSEGVTLQKVRTEGGFDHWEAAIHSSRQKTFFRVRVLQTP